MVGKRTADDDGGNNGANQSRSAWQCVLELDSGRSVVSGSQTALRDAIRRGADLRIYTEFLYNEHIDVDSDNAELLKEVADFRVTYLLENRWAAGIMTLRMPILPPEGFGPRPSMSFFLYNEDGQQAIARPYLDGPPPAGGPSGRSSPGDHHRMPKYHEQERWDAGTNAPSSNFVYDFECYRYLVRDDWREVLSHTSEGEVLSGSLTTLHEAFVQGHEFKVAVRGLCDDVAENTRQPLDHEVFVHVGPGYYCTERRLFSAGTHPLVRVQPGVPLRYASRGWDIGWLMVRTDGFVARWLCDPYSLAFAKSERRHAVRWFVR